MLTRTRSTARRQWVFIPSPLFVAGALFVFGAMTPAHAGAQRANLEKFIHQRVLANGMEIIVAENHGVPLATVEINVRNGS
ncbi:MAG: hypothetical protein ABIT38_00085, partial [Gemmatimonadaceae bacterium]